MQRTIVFRVFYAKHSYENILDGPGVLRERARASDFGRRTTQFFCRIQDEGPAIALRSSLNILAQRALNEKLSSARECTAVLQANYECSLSRVIFILRRK